MGTKFRVSSLNLAQQAVRLKNLFPDSDVVMTPGRLVWRGQLRPTPLSQQYDVEIVYQGLRRPLITILAPTLKAPAGKRLKHVFSGNHPCVHLHDEWNPSMTIATTVVPWTAEWLLHHEIYQATGEWTGGGREPRRRAHSQPQDLGPSESSGSGSQH